MALGSGSCTGCGVISTLPSWLVELAACVGVIVLLAFAAIVLVAVASGVVIAGAVLLRFLHPRKDSP